MGKYQKHICVFSFAALSLLYCASCSSTNPAQELTKVDLKSTKLTAGSAKAVFDKSFFRKGVQEQDITASYFPDNDVVCLQFRVNFQTYYQFWSRANRAAFVEALEKYKKDYEERNLPKKNSKTKRNYGTVRGLLMWETSQFSILNSSYPVFELGYYFKETERDGKWVDLPYFAVTQREAPNENKTAGDPNNANLPVYFNRARADEVAVIFDPKNLESLKLMAPGKSGTSADSAEQVPEGYREADF